MAKVGDLFINVKARTTALTKALKGMRRRLRRFSKSGMAMIGGIAAGFLGFKAGRFLLGNMIGHSREFRKAWAGITTKVGEVGAKLATAIGPELAKGLNYLVDWIDKTGYLDDLFEGMKIALEAIGPIMKKILEYWTGIIDIVSRVINAFSGVSMKDAGRKKSAEEIESWQRAAGPSRLERWQREQAEKTGQLVENVQVPQ
jgi:phage-related protein